MPPLQLRRGCCLRSGVIPGQSQGHASWRCPFLCRLFGRHEMPPLQLRRGVVFVTAPSLLRGRDMPHGAVRCLAASAGGMRCRPLQLRGGVVFVAAPSLLRGRGMPHGAVRFLAASSGGMRCPPLQLDPRSGSGMTDKSKENDTGFPLKTCGNDRRGRMRGFGPARRGPFVSAKGPKTIGARAWPSGCLCPSPDC